LRNVVASSKFRPDSTARAVRAAVTPLSLSRIVAMLRRRWNASKTTKLKVVACVLTGMLAWRRKGNLKAEEIRTDLAVGLQENLAVGRAHPPAGDQPHPTASALMLLASALVALALRLRTRSMMIN